MKVSYEKNILIIGEKKIVFSDMIYQIKEESNKIYVLLDINPKETLSYNDYHNVYCYSVDGIKLWQIGKRPKGDSAVFTMINIDELYLYANDFLGRRCLVNKNNGNIEGMTISK
jgi:hypothetical protein